MLTRRFFSAVLGGVLALPGFVRASSLMPVKAIQPYGTAETPLPCLPLDMPETGWGRLRDGTILAWGITDTPNIAFPVAFRRPPFLRLAGVVVPAEPAMLDVIRRIEGGERIGWIARGPQV